MQFLFWVIGSTLLLLDSIHLCRPGTGLQLLKLGKPNPIKVKIRKRNLQPCRFAEAPSMPPTVFTLWDLMCCQTVARAEATDGCLEIDDVNNREGRWLL